MLIDFDGSVQLGDKSLLPETSGIYFVCDLHGDVLYVGKSVNIKQRWMTHHRRNQTAAIESACISWKLECEERLDEIEQRYIELLTPAWNGTTSEEPKIKVEHQTRRDLRLLAALMDTTMIEAADIAITEKLAEVQGKKS